MSDFQKLKFSDMAYQITTKVNPAETNLDYYVGLEHIDPESLHIRRWGTPIDVKGEKIIVSKGDIIFGKRRAYQRKVAIAEFDCICSAHSMVLRPKEDKILYEVFPFFLQSNQFMERAVQISVGGLSPTINWRDLAEQKFLIPKMDEQRHIAEILWAAEDVIVNTEIFVAEVEHYKQLMVRELFHKGIGHTEFKVMNKIGIIPAEWAVNGLSSLCTIKYGLGQPPKFDANGYPMIRATDIKCGKINPDNIIRVNPETIPNRDVSIKRGDIIVVRSGVNTGDLAMYTLNLSNPLVGYDLLVSPKSDKVEPSYLTHYLLSRNAQLYFKSQSARSAQPHLNSKQLGNTKIPLPLFDEQKRISTILTQIDETITTVRNTIESSKALKMKLINTLLSPAEGDEN